MHSITLRLRGLSSAPPISIRAEPMPHWGIALALGPNSRGSVDAGAEKAAFDEIQKAKSLEVAAPDAERAYVDTLAHRFSINPKADYHALARDYANAMRDLSHRYRDDPDAGTLFAESMMDLIPATLDHGRHSLARHRRNCRDTRSSSSPRAESRRRE